MARYSFALAAGLSLIVSALLGIVLIPWLRRVKFGQTIKEIGPTWHENKQGIPTMGGFLIVAGSLVGLCCSLSLLVTAVPEFTQSSYMHENLNLLIGVITALAFGFIGFVDDYIKVVKKRNLGLLARYKIIMQVAVTGAFLASLYLNGTLSTMLYIPFFGYQDLGFVYYIFSFVLIIGMVNGANLTDGVDGLHASVTFVACMAFMVVSSYIGYYTAGLYAAAMAGGCAGYLVWNFYPAKVIMGDVGSMYLGGAVVVLAYLIGRPEILFFFGLVYLLEAFSDIIQVGYFKLTHGKRIFKMAPIHHHFEMSGWSEVKIVFVFSLVGVFGALAGFLYLIAT